jgi:membrane protein required for colicin V production
VIAAGTAPAASSWNWYDAIVGVAILWGLWSGVRNGLFGEILRVLGLVAMVAAALKFYIPAGDWMQKTIKMPEEPARLLTFVVIAIVVYALAYRVRSFVHGRMKNFKFGAFIENVGGAFAGVVRMLVVMGFLTIIISLMRSPFWHQQVSTKSQFGVFVVSEFPAVAEVVKKEFPETLWFTEDIKRREEPDVENAGTKTTPR